MLPGIIFAGGGSGGTLQFNTYSDFPRPGNPKILYIARDTDSLYYWKESILDYVFIASASALTPQFRGAYDASLNQFPSSGGSGIGGIIQKGDQWKVTVAGVLDGKDVPVGSTLLALDDSPAQDGTKWFIGRELYADDVTIEDINNKLQIKDGGITDNKISPDATIVMQWGSTLTFNNGDGCLYGGRLFISNIDNNVNNVPDIYSDFWDIPVDSGTLRSRTIVFGQAIPTTTLTQNISATDTSFTVSNTSIFPKTGYIKITTGTSTELCYYLLKDDTTNTFSAVMRGQEGTTKIAHNSGDDVSASVLSAGYADSVIYLDNAANVPNATVQLAKTQYLAADEFTDKIITFVRADAGEEPVYINTASGDYIQGKTSINILGLDAEVQLRIRYNNTTISAHGDFVFPG